MSPDHEKFINSVNAVTRTWNKPKKMHKYAIIITAASCISYD